MSNYQFFASEKEMPAFDNRHAIPHFEDDEISKIHFTSRTSEETAMRIIVEEDFYYASQHTDKKYVNFIEWYYSDSNAVVIIDYIKALLNNRFTVSLFNTWMGDTTPVKVKKIDINSLTVKDIQNIWGQDYFDHNECLVIYKKY